MTLPNNQPIDETVSAGGGLMAWVTVHSVRKPERSVAALFKHVSMTGIRLDTNECIDPGDLLVCSPPCPGSSTSVEGLYRVYHCQRAETEGRWTVAGDLIVLEPTEALIRKHAGR